MAPIPNDSLELTIELQTKNFPSLCLDNFSASAGKRWHVIVPVDPIYPATAIYLTLWVSLVQYLYFKHTISKVVSITALGLV